MLSKFGKTRNIAPLICRFFSSAKVQIQPKSVNGKHSPVWAWNEWDPLEEIVVGLIDGIACLPFDLEIKACLGENKYDDINKFQTKLWKDVMDPNHFKSIEQEHNNFIKILEGEGVKVVFPELIDYTKEHTTPYFKTAGIDCCMARDFLLVVGDELIESNMVWKSRYFEFFSYKTLIKDYWRRGAQWTAAPKPVVKDSLFKKNYHADEKNNRYFDETSSILTEDEPVFDAASFIRCGRDIFGLVSQVTNNAGIKWLARHLHSKGIRVHSLNAKASKLFHVDSTFFPVAPGIAVICPDRLCKQMPIIQKAGWDIILAPPSNIPSSFPYYLSSQWLNMNVLMLDSKRVLVEKDEVGIQKMFEKLGIKSIKVPFKHCFAIGGGLHCWTSDIRRKGTLESYFDWQQDILDKYEENIFN